MTSTLTSAAVARPATLAEATALVADGAAPLAGATWVMRAPVRPARHVVLADVPELRGTTAGADTVAVGAMTTHAELAAGPLPEALAALRTAAATSAFPQVRAVATVGGNICAAGFAEADLVPALLALRATVERGDGSTVALAEHLARPAGLVVRVVVPLATALRSGYARFTVRGGGEYAIASVAVAVERDARGSVTAARVALGSVEPVARRSPAAEAVLVGAPLTAESARAAGHAAAVEAAPRDGFDAPGWYRAAVLPALFERAAALIAEEVR